MPPEQKHSMSVSAPRLSKREVVAQALHRSGCGRLIHHFGTWRGLLVLNYHRIGDGRNSPFDRNLWSATAEDFDKQVATVSKDFDVVGIKDLDDIARKPHGRYVLLTFDDGYRDNYTDAFPILKQHGATAVFFLTTGFLDVPQIPWWDEIAWIVRRSPSQVLRASQWISEDISLDDPDHELAIRKLLRVYKTLDGSQTSAFMDFLTTEVQSERFPHGIRDQLWMTWDMVREMEAAGMEFGGHTVNHPILANLTPERQDEEVRGCQARLIQELGHPATAFSYPVGGKSSFNEVTKAALQRHGFRWGFTYFGGHCPLPIASPFAIPRAAIETDVNAAIFHGILTIPQWFTY